MKKTYWQVMDAAGDGTGSGTGAGTGGAGDAGDNGDGAGAGTGTGTGSGEAWYDSFQDTAVKDWLKSYGPAYPNAEAVALKALNLEKFVGADKAGRGIVVPKPEAKPEEWTAFYKRVGGVPEKPEGYKVHSKAEIAEKLAADPMVKQFQEHAHKMGMPPQFFQGAMEWYVGAMESAQNGSVEQFQRTAEREMDELRTEWQGAAYDENVELGRRAARMFIPHESKEQMQEVLTKMEGALGAKMTMKLWASIGRGLSEHGFVGDNDNPGGGGLTPEAARMRIRDLKADNAFTTRLLNGDAEAKAEWTKLHIIANPEPKSS